jgi:hypothetical protein
VLVPLGKRDWAKLHRVAARGICLLSAGAVIGGCAVSGASSPTQFAETTAASTSTATATAHAGSLEARKLTQVELPSESYSLAYDESRDALWYAARTASGRAVLFEASATTGSVLAQFDLPPRRDGAIAVSLGGTIAIAADRSVWVTEPYALDRVDPTTGDITTIVLKLNEPGASAAATDSNAPLPGSAVTSLAFTASSVLVGRLNVPFLQQFSFDLRPMNNIALPSGDAGPVALTIIDSRLLAAFRVQAPKGRRSGK